MNEIQLLIEGGAAGHLAHPFEDADLTFGDMKEMINRGLVGGLDKEAPVTEKLDGQNIAFSIRHGKIVFARNKGHVKNRGENALDRDGIAKQFAGRGGIEKAFTGAAEDLEAAVQKLSPQEVKRMFGNGSKFMSLEVILPDTQNVIPYGKSVLVMHGTISYDKNGNETGRNAQDGKDFGEAVKKVGADRQKTFGIEGAQSIVFSSADEKENKKKADEYNKELDKAAKEFGLNNKSKLSDYRKKWWERELDREEKKTGVKFTKSERAGIVKRWADGDKTFGVRDLQDEKKKVWFRKYEKNSLEKSQKSMIRPIESTFLKAGAQTLKRVTNFVSSNNPETTKQVKKDISTAIKAIQSSNDPAKLAKLEKELERLKDIGIDNVVPSEGLVFMYKGKPYKFTGAFAPINQINGTFKFDKPKEEKPEAKPKEKYEKPKEKEEKKKAEKQPKRTVAIFAGRFQPFHAGHYSVYKSLVDKFGKDNVYIASSDVTDPVRSPFGFSDKQNIITTMFDVPADKVVQVKNPYRPVEVLDKVGKDTSYVTAVSQKDAERLDQGGKYFKNYDKTPKGTHKGYEDEGYYIVAPEMKLQVNGGNISGTQLRATFGNEFLSDSEKKDIFIQVYGKFNKKVYDKIVGKTTKAERAKLEQEKAKVEKDKKTKEKTDKTDKKGGKEKETGKKRESKLDKKTRKKLKAVLSTTVVNPETGNEILVRSALRYGKGSKVRKAAEKEIENALSSTNEGFPGGVGVGLVLPGGYINGAPSQKNVNKMKKRIKQQRIANEVIEEANALLKSVNSKSNRKMLSFEHDSRAVYNPVVLNKILNSDHYMMSYISEVIQEEVREYVKNNPIKEEEEKDPDVTYTDTDGESKTIKYSSAIKYDKEHPAYKAAQALKPKADAAAAEKPGEEEKGKEKPGEKKAGEKPKAGAPGAPAEKPQPQALGGAELASDAEKEKAAEKKAADKKAEKEKKDKEAYDKLSPQQKADAEAAAEVKKEMDKLEHHEHKTAKEIVDAGGPVRKGIAMAGRGLAEVLMTATGLRTIGLAVDAITGKSPGSGMGTDGLTKLGNWFGNKIATIDKNIAHFIHHQKDMWAGSAKGLMSFAKTGKIGATKCKSKNPDTGEEEEILVHRSDGQKKTVLRNPDGSVQRHWWGGAKKVWIDKEPPVEPKEDDPKYKQECEARKALGGAQYGGLGMNESNNGYQFLYKGILIEEMDMAGCAKAMHKRDMDKYKKEKQKYDAYHDKTPGPDGKTNKERTNHNQEQQRKGLDSLKKFTASLAVGLVTGGAIHGIVGGTGAISGIAGVFSHGAGEFGKHVVYDMMKHAAQEAVLGFNEVGASVGGAGVEIVRGLMHESISFQDNVGKSILEQAEEMAKKSADMKMGMTAYLLTRTLDIAGKKGIPNKQLAKSLKKWNAKKEMKKKTQADPLSVTTDTNVNESVSYSRVSMVKEFTNWASKRLNLENKPQIKIVKNESFASTGQPSLGAFSPTTNEIYVVMENRLIADVLRTIAHEMVHQKQMEMGLMTGTNEDGRTGSAIENKANAVAGILLREYGKLKKEIYTESVKKKSTDEDINVPLEKGDTVLMGKFKNKKVVVKDIGTDDHGMPTINGKQATTFRKVKTETIKKVDDKYVVYPKKGGKRLGTHDSLSSAKKQLAAIEINKENINETSALSAQSTDSRPSGTFLPYGATRKLDSNDGVNKSDNWYVNGGYTQMSFPSADDIFGDEMLSTINTIRYSDDNTKNSTAPKTEFNNKKHNLKLDINEDVDLYEIYGKSIMDNLNS